MIQLQERRTPHAFSLFNLGFRPFFLGGAVVSVILIGLWLSFLTPWLTTSTHYYPNLMLWHGHEMLFGFTFAIIAGFLMTAVKTWTHAQTPFGLLLALIFLLWLAGRIVPFMTFLPAYVVAITDLLFAPIVAISIGYPVLKSKNYRNLIFIPLLTGFFISNLLIHLEALGITKNSAELGIQLALGLIVIVISLIGGRVIPFFSERGVQDVKCVRYTWIEKNLLPLSGLWLLTVLMGELLAVAIASMLLGIIHSIRLYGWFSAKIVQVPLVWVLQTGYLFLPIGFYLMALAAMQFIPFSAALHGFSVGAIGLLTLGMMSRVSLGHTGRTLKIKPIMAVAFLLLVAATFIRLLAYAVAEHYLDIVFLSGGLWILAWVLFIINYAPILIKPRIDGLYG